MVNENTSLQELYDIVISTLAEVMEGELFIVKELFRGFEWNRIPKSYRTKLGAMVLVFANSEEGSLLIEPIKKTPQNQQIYKKL